MKWGPGIALRKAFYLEKTKVYESSRFWTGLIIAHYKFMGMYYEAVYCERLRPAGGARLLQKWDVKQFAKLPLPIAFAYYPHFSRYIAR